jgi:uncharacterized metal-binding protein YceD (DUF177 family)
MKKRLTFAADFARMSNRQEYIADLQKLNLGSYKYEFDLDDAYFAAIEKSEILGGKVRAQVVLNIRQDGVLMSVKAKGTVQVTCDRCLDPMDLPVDVSEDNIEAEEGVKELDLAWQAYELICVNLPVVHSHPEGGCNPQMDALLQSHLCSTVEEPEAI